MRVLQRLLFILLAVGFLTFLSLVPPVNAVNEVATASITDFDVFDADIRDVLRGLAELGDINVLFDPAVKGTITIKLKHGLTIKEAIELICQTYGHSYRWIPESRSIIIGSEKTFASFEVTQTKVYQLHYAKVEEVAKGLSVIAGSTKISVDPRTNQLTVKASILEHQNIEEVIKSLDREMPQINIEARVEELTQSASNDLGVNWTFGSTSTNVDFKVVSSAQLTALEQSNKARLLANPNISTTDSQEGRIFIGEKFPIISTTTTEGTTTTSVTYIEFGTNLSVTPRINESDTVTVIIKAFVSSATEWKTAADGSQVPVIKTREANSVVRLREGETFVLSGLNMRKANFTKTGVSGISRIPIIGRLFSRNVDKPYDDSEICIFVTPKIIKNRSASSQVSPTTSAPTTPISNQASVTLEPPQQQEQSTTTTSPPVTTTTEPVKEGTSQVIEVTPPTTTAPTTAPVTTTDTTPPTTAPVTTTGTTPPVTEPTVAPPPATEPTVPPVTTTTEPPPEQPTVTTLATEPMVGMKVTLNIKAGDTINLIAKKYGIAPESILTENKMKADEILKVGQALVVPIPQNHLYQVKPKETLWRIAKRYGTTVALLQELNKVTDVTKLEVGQTIILPVAVDQIADKNY